MKDKDKSYFAKFFLLIFLVLFFPLKSFALSAKTPDGLWIVKALKCQEATYLSGISLEPKCNEKDSKLKIVKSFLIYSLVDEDYGFDLKQGDVINIFGYNLKADNFYLILGYFGTAGEADTVYSGIYYVFMINILYLFLLLVLAVLLILIWKKNKEIKDFLKL